MIIIYQNNYDRMHENLALEQPVDELDNLEKHARNLVKGRCVLMMIIIMNMVVVGWWRSMPGTS